MQDLFELTPELLLEQSQEMSSLCAAYENLFANISSDLNGINGSWSDLLSNNFSAKIGSAQKSFSGALTMLRNSASSTRSVAETALEMDNAWASKIGGSMFNSGILSEMIVKTAVSKFMVGIAGLKDAFADAQEAQKYMNTLKEKINGELSPAQEAWLDFIGGKIKGAKFMGGMKNPLEIAEKVLEGDYLGAMEKTGDYGITTIAKELIKEAIEADKLDIADKDVGTYAKYALNITKSGMEALFEFNEEPSLENFGEIAWNVTAQPILNMAGKDIEKYVKMIPGISDYYAEKGAEDIGQMASICLGDFYGMVSGDEEMRQYASTYYESHGGLFEGLYDGQKEIVSFVVDNGGVGQAAYQFAKTAIKDSEGMLKHNWENAKILYQEGAEWVENVGDFVEESGGAGEAAKKFFTTAAKDTWSAVEDLSKRVWNSVAAE